MRRTSVGMSLLTLVLAAWVGVWIGTSPAVAQLTISQPRWADYNNFNPLNPDDSTSWFGRETAIGVNPLNPKDLLCGAIEARPVFNTSGRCGYSISLDGAATMVGNETPLPTPMTTSTVRTGDPTITADPRTGDLWYGAALSSTGGPQGLYVVRKPANSTTLDTPVWVAMCQGFCEAGHDKPLIAAGPAPGAPGQSMLYMTYGGPLDQRLARADITTPSAVSFEVMLNVPWTPHYASCSAVLPSGRLVVAYRTVSLANPADMQILCVYSDDRGTTWSSPAVVSPPPYTNNMVGEESLGSTSVIPGTFRAFTYPAVAVDAERGWVYVTWCQQSGPDPSVPGNVDVDVYLAVSLDGGASFQVFDPSVLHLPGDQFMPWVAVDGRGGVNLLWNDTARNPNQPDDETFALLDVRYARAIVGTDSPGAPGITSLTLQWLTDAPYSTQGLITMEPTIGDYQMIVAAGCQVYACYAKRAPVPGLRNNQMHYFVQPINVCPSDFDSSGFVETMDAALYTSAYGAQDPRADLNDDQSLTGQDLQLFWEDYTGGD